MPKEPEAKKTLKPNIVKFIAPAGVVVVTLVLAGFLVANKDAVKKSATVTNTSNTQVAGSETSNNGTAPVANVNIQDVNIKDDPYLGDANAKVTLAYWTDFQCPYCKQFELATMPSLIQKYVNNGQLKIVFKDFQFLGNDSLAAALYARAIWELYPKEYFPWREAMFNKQDGENGGFGDEASIKALTATIAGIDVNKVSDLAVNKQGSYQALITADRTEGAKMGISGTPGFITGTKIISGAVDLATISQDIDAQLK